MPRQKHVKPVVCSQNVGARSQHNSHLNSQIRSCLQRIHVISGVKAPRRPANLINTKAKCNIYIGFSTGVTGLSDPKFPELGQVYFVSLS